jgi:outer membrane protein OmpA-like peptidoglycan-associated protein
MVRTSNRFSFVGIAVVIGLVTLSGCATHKYVKQQIGTITPQIEQANTQIKENGERIDAVDRRATQGIQGAQTAATNAQQAADRANGAAQTAQNAAQAAQRQADSANQGVQQANNRIGGLETRINGLDNYTSSESQTITFKNNSAVLSDDAKATLDRIAGAVSGQKGGYLIELQGFTDDRGSANYNDALSQRRAEAALRYLVSKNVPLFRISIVGLGEANPVADNKTRAGRDQNRRVEVRVLKSAAAGAATN